MEVLESFNGRVDELLNVAVDATGLGLDKIRFLFCSVLAFPLALVFLILPNRPVIKHLYSLLLGIWFGWVTMGYHILHSFVSSTVSYLLMVYLPPKLSSKFVFVWSMGYLSVSHLYRMQVDYMGYTLDFTGPQMLLTLKLTTFAFDYLDGTLPVEQLKPYGRKMALKRLPNILEFYAYVYFFPGLLAGPAVNMIEYLSFADMSMFKDCPNGKPPLPFIPFLKKFFWVLVSAVGLTLSMKYSLYYCRGEEFFERSFLFRFFYIWLAAILARYPYYFAWTVSEESCILAGIGFNGYEKSVAKWDRATNCQILDLEFAQNFKEITDAWNIRTDKWLKHYIYERVPRYGVALTFLNSSVWHGFYPGYYFSFMSSAFLIQVGRAIRKNIRPWFMKEDVPGDAKPKPSKKIYDLVCVICASYALNYVMTAFLLLGFSYSLRVWKSIFFIGHVGAILLYILATYVIRAPRTLKKA